LVTAHDHGHRADRDYTYSFGTYHAITVTDDMGAVGATATTITVTAPNVAPVARITAPASGYAGSPISFSAALSTDDGTIASYAWDFGDGAKGTGVTVSHTYATVDSYIVTLTVIDERGATGSASATLNVTQNPAKVLKVVSPYTYVRKTTAKGVSQTAVTVKVVDGNGNPVGGAVVTGYFDPPATSVTLSASTGSVRKTLGLATLLSSKYTSATTCTFTITNVTKSGYTY
jgi:PKD repeat protein